MFYLKDIEVETVTVLESNYVAENSWPVEMGESSSNTNAMHKEPTEDAKNSKFKIKLWWQDLSEEIEF